MPQCSLAWLPGGPPWLGLVLAHGQDRTRLATNRGQWPRHGPEAFGRCESSANVGGQAPRGGRVLCGGRGHHLPLPERHVGLGSLAGSRLRHHHQQSRCRRRGGRPASLGAKARLASGQHASGRSTPETCRPACPGDGRCRRAPLRGGRAFGQRPFDAPAAGCSDAGTPRMGQGQGLVLGAVLARWRDGCPGCWAHLCAAAA
mmetsp:Transcript_79480/g.199814  ORF Transcript_79480/g.199814 Transcript_79480/m.199814 type:complete len:202 (-) Transcript_79480:389-994(-)